MRLVSVRLRDFRGVADATVEFGDGVTVVEGPNEVGKSSVAEAIRLLRTLKASSQRSEVKAVKPVDRDAGPDVELRLRTGPYSLTYRKRWLRATLTELRVDAPRPESLTGDEAHERFLAILDETLDVDLLEALEVLQGRSLDRPDLAHIAALHRALDETGGVVEGHDELLDRVEEEYARYFTGTGRATGEHRRLTDAIGQLTASVTALRERSDEVDRLAAEHARHTARLGELDDELAASRTALAALEERANGLEELRRADLEARRGLADAQRALDEATAARAARAEAVAQLADRAAGVAELDAQVQATEAERDRCEGDLAAARKAFDAAEHDRDDARGAARLAASALERHRDRTEHAELVERVRRAREAERQRLGATAALAGSPVDDTAVARLVALDTEVRVATSARDAAAAQVVVRRLGTEPVTVDGQAVPAGSSVETAALDTVRIEAPGLLAVEVRPGTPPADLEDTLRAVRERLADALRGAGVGSLDEAREVAVRRRDAATDLVRAKAALELALGGDTLAAIEERLAALAARLAGTADGADDAGTGGGDARGAREDAGAGGVTEAVGVGDPAGEPRGDLAALERAAAAARAAEEDADSALAAARERVERERTAVGTAREAWVRASEALRAATEEHDKAAEALAVARASRDDPELDEALAAASGAVGEKQALADAAHATLAAAEPDVLEMQLRNARELVVGKATERDATRTRLSELGALLDDRAREGIYDRLAAAEGELAAAQAQLARLSRAAAAVDLLRSTLLRHRDEAQRRYVAPFTDRIDRLGRVVFGPGFSVQVTQDLAIESRTLDGRTVPFESLSAGAKEQLALLGRLACAQLVDPAEGAPVILDDTLGFADPERLAALNVVLHDVGRTAQVVLLTCQPQRFATLGGAHVVHLAAS